MKRNALLLLIAFLLSAMGCGGGSSDSQVNMDLQPCEIFSSIAGKFGEIDLSEINLAYDSTLYNESLEEVYLDDAYEYLGLDKNDTDDVYLLSYIFGVANYRLIIGQIIGERVSLFWGTDNQLKEELSVFIYDLDDYAIGDPIVIEDT